MVVYSSLNISLLIVKLYNKDGRAIFLTFPGPVHAIIVMPNDTSGFTSIRPALSHSLQAFSFALDHMGPGTAPHNVR